MKRNSSGLTGANAASIVGLKAILAQEKAARAGKATSTPSPTTQSLTSNKGTLFSDYKLMCRNWHCWIAKLTRNCTVLCFLI